MSDHHKPTISISTNNSSDPLFSTLLGFSAIVLLYLPRFLWRFLLSPVFILAGFLFLSLLRLGSTQRSLLTKTENQSQTVSEIESSKNDGVLQSEAVIEGSCVCFEESFVQWNVRAPLEVIYEDQYEGEDLDKEASNESDPELRVGLERYPSLSLYYPETDSDSSSDGAWPESMDDNVCFMWNDDDDDDEDDDEDRDELIEIALDKATNKIKAVLEFESELELEDNLIEIDISPTSANADEFSDV